MSHSTNISPTTPPPPRRARRRWRRWPGGSGVAYHVGTRPDTPATTPHGTAPVTSAPYLVVRTTLARGSDGSVWVAWFTESFASDQATGGQAPADAGGEGQAPGSAVRPGQQSAVPVGGVRGPCRRGLLPRLLRAQRHHHVRAHRAVAGPRQPRPPRCPVSTTQHAIHVAIAAAPGGHLWVLWYATSQNKIHAIRTNATSTKFGPVQAIAAPPSTSSSTASRPKAARDPSTWSRWSYRTPPRPPRPTGTPSCCPSSP